VDIYIDESGDLGFKLGSSKFFIHAYLITNDSEPIRRVMKRFLGNKTRFNSKYLHVEHCFSHSNKCIQVGDFIAGA
jgi:hypothetical protein